MRGSTPTDAVLRYDADLRLSSLSVSHTGTTLFSSQRGYDAVGNVTSVGTTLAAGGTPATDNQVFCYDDQHRLTWAGSVGTPNCGTSLTPGSLSSANYTQTYTYDTLDRLQSGPLGSYTYGDSAHLHAVTSIANGGTTAYSTSYDAGGNMTCRAADGTTTCAGTPTGAVLSFDNEGRLSAWQNTPSNPTSSDSFLYDGAGNRVEQQTTTNGSIVTSTVYVDGGLEEITSSGGSTTLTKYLGAAGLPTAERVGTNGPLSYLATDGQGTVSETLDGSGNVTSAQLYTPYGNVRYSSGSSPTSMGYTGQRSDTTTGLDYYHARYYDPAAGQFSSADTVQDGLNRYGYVRGNPTTFTDPTGHKRDCQVIMDNCTTEQNDYGPGIDWGNNVRLMVQGIPGCPVGCAKASKGGAIVGPGKRTDKGDGTSPVTYKWGDQNNGAIAYGFTGELLQALIDMEKAVLKALNNGKYDIAKGLIVAFFAGVGAIPAFLNPWVAVITTAAGTFVGTVLAAQLDKIKVSIQDAIDALTDAQTYGRSVWYVESIWQGHAGRYGSDFGTSDFISGGSPYEPPLEVLYTVGYMMMTQCADYANSHPGKMWGNSPGIPAAQDSSYTPPPPPPGC